MCTKPITIIDNEGKEIKVKCGKCYTCKLERSSAWAIKLINEAKYHKKACFITLTFDNKILLDKNSKAIKKYGANASFVFNTKYSMKYFQKFIKRLRQIYKDKYISYYHVAEFGEKTKRPHHHAIVYGINFDEDRKEMEKSKTGHIQFYSQTLQDCWACGRTSIQDINENNIIYISQYTLKKLKDVKDDKYKPLMTFSNRCKISSKYIKRYPKEITKGYLEDKEGHKFSIPKSYIKALKNDDKYFAYIQEYENRIDEYLSKHTKEELEKIAQNREKIKILRREKFGHDRDF